MRKGDGACAKRVESRTGVCVSEGIVNVLKPPGMTSSDVVSDVRHIFGMKRVGHTGTLDPGAAGVLGICLGRATRLFDLLIDKQKEYICEICFGASADTQDSYGRETASSDAKVGEDALRMVLPRFIGEIEQTVPVYSALKVDGKAMYAHARAGNEIEPKVRPTTIYGIDELGRTGENRYLLRINCSKGTYIRTVCYDIGQALGVPAYMSFLLRSRAGELRIGDSHSLRELSEMKEDGTLESAVIAPDKAILFLPEAEVPADPKERRLLLNGAEVDSPAKDGQCRLYAEGKFIGVGFANAGRLRLDISFL